MEKIIDPILNSEIMQELSNNCFVRKTINGANDIYIVDALNQPKTMQEIGRLREMTFREAGGGTGKSVDIDSDDVAVNGYRQLIVWNPEQKEIIGGYRYIIINSDGNQHFSMQKYFNLDNEFMDKYYPHTMELGRSFIQPKYQSRAGGRKGIYALDNLWDGLGAIVADNNSVEYIIGKVTMYTHINSELINMLYSLLIKYFPVENNIICPKEEFEYVFDKNQYSNCFNGLTYSEAMKTVTKRAKELGENYPPLFAAYANLSETMKVFGTVFNCDFGNVLETAIMITVKDLKQEKYERYVKSYISSKEV